METQYLRLEQELFASNCFQGEFAKLGKFSELGKYHRTIQGREKLLLGKEKYLWKPDTCWEDFCSDADKYLLEGILENLQSRKFKIISLKIIYWQITFEKSSSKVYVKLFYILRMMSISFHRWDQFISKWKSEKKAKILF